MHDARTKVIATVSLDSGTAQWQPFKQQDFMHDAKRSHKLALMHIGQNLKGAQDKELMLRPIDLEAPKTDAHVDTGLESEHSANPDAVK